MAERIEKILLQLDIDVKQLTINLQTAKEKIELLTKQQQTARLELKKLEEAGQTNSVTYQNLTRQIQQYDIELKSTKDSAAGYTRQLKLIEDANRAAEGSLNEQKALLSILTAEYNSLSQEERDNTEAGKNLGTQIRQVTDNLKAQESSLGNNRRNVGNYEAAIRSAFEQLNKSKTSVNDIKLSIDQLNNKFKDGQVNQEQYKTELNTLNTELAAAEGESGILAQKLEELKQITLEGAENFKSLRQRLREARDEATLAQDKFSAGLINEDQLISAQQKVANLSDEMGDFNKRIEALNPDAKFKAFTQLAQGAAGAVGTVSGAMGLLGGQSEDAAQALLKVQQFMQFTQGLNQLGELADTLSNVRVVLGLTTKSTQAQTAAQIKNNTATATGTVATEGLAVAEGEAAVAARGLSASMATLAGPLTIVALVAAGVLASFNAFGETDFAETTKDITGRVKEENEEHERTIELLTGVNRSRVTEAENILKTARAEQQLKLSKATTQQEKNQIIIDDRPKLRALEDDLLQIKANALAAELKLNEEHIKKLQVQKETAETTLLFPIVKTDGGSLRKALGLASQVADEERRSQIEKERDAAIEEIKINQEKNAKITDELKKTAGDDAEVKTNRRKEETDLDKDFQERQRQALNQASLIRIGLIKDLQTRELAAERETTRQKIEKLLEDEKANAVLIEAEKAASSQRIIDINKKFALEELQERNALDIAGTLEGTEARIEAERVAAERIRDFQLQNDSLTAEQRLKIERDTIVKIGELKQELINQDLEIGQKEIEAAQDTANAILAVRRAQATAPEQRTTIDIEQIQSDLKFELDKIEKNNDSIVASYENRKQQELELLRSGKDEKIKATEEYKAQELEIINKYNNLINQSNKSSDEQALKAVVDSGNNTINVLNENSNKKISALISLRQTELDAAQPENQFQAQIALLDAEEEAELASFKKRLANGEAFEQEGTAIKAKYTKIRKDLEKDLLNSTLAATSQTLGQAASLFRQHTAAYKVLASAQVVIDTYTGATAAYKSMAGIPYVGPVLGAIAAAVAIASGLANLAKINEVKFYQGGYTGDGDPKSQSLAIGRKPYIYHRREYVIDHKTLQDPEVGSLVSNVIEPKRLGRINISADNLRQSIPVRRSFADGGFAIASVQPSLIATPPISIDFDFFSETVVNGVREAFKSVTIQTDVKEVIDQTAIVNKVQQRANL